MIIDTKQLVVIILTAGIIPGFFAEDSYAQGNQIELNDEIYMDFNSVSITKQGYASLNSLSDSDYNFSASLGYKPHNNDKILRNTRLEAEFSIKNTNIASNVTENSTSRSAIMANAFYDFEQYRDISSYIGVGAGIANVRDIKETNSKKSSALPAYQAMAGISYQPQSYPDTNIHIGYKYQTADKSPAASTSNAILEDSLSSHNVEAYVNIDF